MTSPSESVGIETWRRLYAAADHIHKLAPWTWMRETDVFGIQFPGMEDAKREMWNFLTGKTR